ncbi:MAG: hypothetical protein ACREBC_24000, partial [Pyrinomonadaceae bacterium]
MSITQYRAELDADHNATAPHYSRTREVKLHVKNRHAFAHPAEDLAGSQRKIRCERVSVHQA